MRVLILITDRTKEAMKRWDGQIAVPISILVWHVA